jgi:hypothetical protein
VSQPDPLVRAVDVAGFRPDLPQGSVGSALMVLAALGIVLLFAAPTPPGLSAWIQFAIGRARERLVARRARHSPRGAAALAWAQIARDIAPAGPFAIVDAAACALVALLPFAQFRVASTLDIGILLVGATTAMGAATLASRGSLATRLRATLHVAWQHVPALAAVACVVLATGSVRIQEIARAQTGSPWDWLAFRSPAALLALFLLLSCMRIDLGDAAASPGLRAILRAHRILVAGLAAVLFLGAWGLPGVPFADEDAHPILQLVGLLGLMAKTAVVLGAVAWSRWALAPMSLSKRSRISAFWLFPAGLIAFGAVALWSRLSPPSAVQQVTSGALLIGFILTAAATVHRLRQGILSGPTEARLSPFL